MRFAVISDVHGNVVALGHVLEHMRARSVDGVINLGDCVSAPLWPRETFELLAELNALTVRGNHDRWIDDPQRIAGSPTVAFSHGELSAAMREALAGLPPTLSVGEEIFAVHGTPTSDVEYLLEESVNERLCLVTASTLSERLRGIDAELVLCGHSHQQNAAWASGKRLIVNPGSVGCPRYAGNRSPDLNEAGSPHARYAIVTRRQSSWSVEFFVLDYDWTPVVERARSLGRSDWASAFARDA